MTPTQNTLLIERLRSAFSNNDDGSDLLKICENIALEIEKKELNLCNVVEQLGDFLTDKDIGKRENGVRSLSTIIEKLPQDFLTEKEIELLTSFYCDRLKDHHSIIPAVISGILAIVQMKYLPQDAPAKLLRTMDQHVRCQSELQENRNKIYLIFQCLLNTRINDLIAMGPDFVYGFISSIDGESDPRNLILLFSILPVLIKQVPLGHLTEEMFEVIACYFPIDFNSGEKAIKGITRNDLSASLEKCLSSSPDFAEFCIPLIMEKLDSKLKVAKLDSLSLLLHSLPIFGSKGLVNFLDELWILLRRETLSGNDQEIKALALQATTAVSSCLSNDEKALQKFLDKVIADTKTSLCDVQLSLFWPAQKVLEAAARGSKQSCVRILKFIVPLCLGQYSSKKNLSDKVSLMDALTIFLEVTASMGLKISEIDELTWADIPNLYMTELQEGENVVKSKALIGLATQVSSLSGTRRLSLYDRLCQEVDAGNQELKSAYHLTLLAYAKNYPHEIRELLQDRIKIDLDVPQDALQNRLNVLSSIVTIPELAAKILPSLIDLAVCNIDDYALIALSCLQNLLSSDNDNEFDIHNYLEEHCHAIGRLLESARGKTITRVMLVSDVCCSIVFKLSLNDQKKVVEKHFPILKSNMKNDVILMEGIITPLFPSIVESIPMTILEDLFEISLKNTDAQTRLSACKLVAILMNKLNEDKEFTRHLNIFREVLTQILESENGFEEKKAAVILHTWLTKTLIVRGSKQSQDFLDNQFNILNNVDIGQFAAEEFKTLIDKCERTLTEKNHCTIKIFYKQRIFQHTVQQNPNFEGVSRQNYLIAFGHIIGEVSMDLLLINLRKIVSLLIELLSVEKTQLLVLTLGVLEKLLITKNDVFHEQIQNFIPRLLKLSRSPQMHIRIAAMNCLHSYSDYPTVTIQPYKLDVIEELVELLDDKKRLVRKAAVRTRTRWFLVGAPGGLE